MNTTDKRSLLANGVLFAAVLAMGAGCCTSDKRSAYNYDENLVPAAGAPPAEYQTQTGTMTSGQDVVIPLEKEQLSVGKQDVDNGAIRVKKIVKTRTVNQPVEIREEQVRVERVPDNNANNGNTSLNTPFQGGEITIPLRREQPLVQTQVVPNGSVVIHKQDTEQQVNAQGQARFEHVIVEPVGNPQNVTIPNELRADYRDNEAAGSPPVQSGYATGAGANQQPVTQLNDLCADDSTGLVGRPVALINVKIDKVINDHFIKVRAENGKHLFVRIDQPTPGLREGEIVNLNGVVQSWDTERAQRDSHGWAQTDVQSMHDQKIVLEVQNVSVQQ